MSKSPNHESAQSERGACRPLNLDGPNAQSLRVLARENQRLREQVTALREMLGRQAAPFSANPNRDLRERQPDNLGDALRPFAGHQLLTARERAVLARIIRGASSKQAARAMSISVRTVEFHRANIMLKLGARNIAELVRIVLGEQT